MNSTIARAVTGFIVLSSALIAITSFALMLVGLYAGGHWIINGGIILIALGTQVSIYASTLHDPIYRWIREPARAAEEAAHEAEMDRMFPERKS